MKIVKLIQMSKSFDILGSIALFRLEGSSKKEQKEFGIEFLKKNKNIETVAVIDGEHKTKFRIQKLRIIAGKKSFSALYKELGCLFKIRLDKSFFSSRLSFERQRTLSKVMPDENVAVFFAGVGPFSIIIGKHSKAKKVYSIELNPEAVKDMKENIILNKVQDKVIPIKADVKKYSKKHLRKFDRILMPLPAKTEHFLDTAFQSIKNKGVVHYYHFTPRAKNQFKATIDLIKETAKKHKAKVKVLEKRVVRSTSPKDNHVVIDFKVSF